MRTTPAALLAALALAATPLSAQAPAAPLQLALAGGPPAAAYPQDPANTLYRQAREALNAGQWQRAAALFQRVRQQYPRSRYTPDALYWEAFARYRVGSTGDLQYALGALQTQARDYPRAATHQDAAELMARIRGELARHGDARAAERVASSATQAAQCGRGSGDEDDDERLAALNALLQMDADRAMPLLRQVLARRDACSERLRRQATFLVSQKAGDEAETILLNVARTDPSPDVRGQAVFWLSQTGSERAVDAILEVLRSSNDPQVQEKAIFALSQHPSARAAATLRSYAENEGAPEPIREKAIFWIGQHASPENAAWLRGLFGRLRDDELKGKTLFSLSQMRGQGNERWILGVAQDASQPVEVRKQALFWAGQSGIPLADITAMYDRVREPALREHVIFVLSQRHESAALDKLIDIARHDPDRQMRAKAVFWLGQSQDPRAQRVISEIIGQ